MSSGPTRSALFAAGLLLTLSTCTPPRAEDGPLLAVRIEPANPSLDEGGQLPLKPIAVYQNGFRRDITDEIVTWSVADETIATVDVTGTITALLPGQTQVVATFDGVSSPAEILTVRPTATPTPTPGACDTGVQVLVSEVVYDANSTDGDKEYIEIYNPGLAAIDISGWAVEDLLGASAKAFILPAPLTIANGDFLVISDGDAALFNAEYGVLPDVANSGISLGNSGGDAILLRDCQGTQIDAVVYGPAVDAEPIWACAATPPTSGSGQSIERNRPGTDTDDCTDWESDKTPTPGAAPL